MRKLLGDVDEFAAAVVALARIAFGVLVGELRALRGQDRGAGVVLRGDQLDVVFLPLVLAGDGFPQLGIGVGERSGAAEHGGRERAWRENAILASRDRCAVGPQPDADALTAPRRDSPIIRPPSRGALPGPVQNDGRVPRVRMPGCRNGRASKEDA